MVIVKKTSAVGAWIVWHTGIPATDQMDLNSTAATGANATCFNSTIPTSSVFSVGTNAATNGSTATFVAYVFAPISSFSSMGQYTGNGSADGPFIYTGFKPALIILKRDGVNGWDMMDTSRSTYNPVDLDLQPNSTAVEAGPGNQIDYLSNGFKIRTASGNLNTSGGTHIYAAFASNPVGGSGAAPATAR
jgi:hypothetical protein